MPVSSLALLAAVSSRFADAALAQLARLADPFAVAADGQKIEHHNFVRSLVLLLHRRHDAQLVQFEGKQRTQRNLKENIPKMKWLLNLE